MGLVGRKLQDLEDLILSQTTPLEVHGGSHARENEGQSSSSPHLCIIIDSLSHLLLYWNHQEVIVECIALVL